MLAHKIICGDCITAMHAIKDNSIDSCVTDPPYGLEFMGKGWDTFNALSFQEFTYQWATELYRILKPGAHILVFGGTRTYHRMVCAIEDAGFEVRDMIEWFYGGGFPKSLDISKQLDKKAGEEREVIGIKKDDQPAKTRTYQGFPEQDTGDNRRDTKITAPASEQAIEWDGWGTGLKPAHEPILLARKPLSEPNIASNVLKWGVGGINVHGCRIKTNGRPLIESKSSASMSCYGNGLNNSRGVGTTKQGRFPANLILGCCCEEDELIAGDGGDVKEYIHSNEKNISWKMTSKLKHERHYIGEKGAIHTNPNCVCRMLDEQSGETLSRKQMSGKGFDDSPIYGTGDLNFTSERGHNDKGGASRFFYQAKASQKERWFYCTFCKRSDQNNNLDKHTHNAPSQTRYKYIEFHPTQKPIQLIQYLIRLITPINKTIIDPFLGSGTALIAAEREQVNCTGIDSHQPYCNIAYKRVKEETKQATLTDKQSTISTEIGFI